jgi:hypothetical protein
MGRDAWLTQWSVLEALQNVREEGEEKHMKLKKGFVTHTVSGTQVMVAAGPAADIFQGIVRSNETAAFIVDCLRQETTEEEIVQRMTENYEVDADTAASGVKKILEKLKEIGAVE